MSAMSKLDPRYAISLNGFDRRGAVASINNASASGFTVSGCWSDQADFAVVYLWNADDLYGHLFTSRYLPDFSLAGVTLDFDLAVTGCMNPTSAKYPSVPWNALSYGGIAGADVDDGSDGGELQLYGGGHADDLRPDPVGLPGQCVGRPFDDRHGADSRDGGHQPGDAD
jgi:hypothetical protein